MSNEEDYEAEVKHLMSTVSNLAMLVRRLCRRHPNATLVQQAKDFLNRNGLEGSVLRDNVIFADELKSLFGEDPE